MENLSCISIHEIDVENPDNMYIGKHIGYFDVDKNCNIKISEHPTKFDNLYIAIWLEDIIKFCFDNKLLILPENN